MDEATFLWILIQAQRAKLEGWRGPNPAFKQTSYMAPSHRTRRGHKFDFGLQQKFLWDMKFWGKCYQKMKKMNNSTEGPMHFEYV